MGKVIILNLIDGSFTKGFHVTGEIAQEGEPHFAYATGKLPRNAEIPQLYQRWQTLYRSLVTGSESYCRITAVSATNVSIPEIRSTHRQLEAKVKQWLDAAGMRFIVELIYQHLKDDHEEIRVVFRTRNLELQRLPWHCWKIFDRYSQSEAVLSLPVRKPEKAPPTDRVKILVVLGDSSTYGEATQIGIDQDLASLQMLHNAEIVPLNQPSLAQLDAALWNHNPEILFFAGHSASEMDGRRGSIYLNSQEVITIGVLKPAIRKAVRRGLQLAIFNSCDGLGFVQELAELHIPQVIVMREPVPDIVAQEFLNHFIKSFSQGLSLCLAVKQARERIHYWEHRYPGVTSLPMIFQNPAENPYTWRQIQGLPTIAATEPQTVTDVDLPEIRSANSPTLITPLSTQIAQEQIPQEVPPVVPPTVRYCQHCQSRVLWDARFCFNCGFKLHPPYPPTDPSTIVPPACMPESPTQTPVTQNPPPPVQLSLSQSKSQAVPIEIAEANSGNFGTQVSKTPPALLNNRYRVVRVLASGGFGDTFLAEDSFLPSNRLCVIKQLKLLTDNLQIYGMVQRRFQREAAVLEELGQTSKQIPELYAYFEEAELFYLVQEWVEGQTLSHKVRAEGLMNQLAVKQLLEQILPVLSYIHGRGIIHRDIKPDNIILRHRDGLPVLIDFGAVKESVRTVLNSQEQTSSIVIGTPGYMSPEQGVGRPVFSSDLYGLGLTAVYLLTGKLPYDLPTNHRTGEFSWRSFAPTVSDRLAAILDRMIQYHPRDRFSTAQEITNALQH